MLQKQHNISFWRDGEQPLPDTHQQVINLVRFRRGFALFDFADREGVMFPMVKKLAVSAFAFPLEGCHANTFSAILLQSLAICRPRHRNASPVDGAMVYCKSFSNTDLQREPDVFAT